MSTQDNDPFAATPTPAAPGTPEQAATPPGVLTPGVLPEAAPAAPSAYSAPGAPTPFPTNYAPLQPVSGLAKWAIIGTGSYTAVTILSAVTASATLERTKETLRDPANASVDMSSTLLGFLSFITAIAGYVLLALWMHRVRGNLTAQGRKPGGPPAVEWWGWFVPLANFVLPFLGMRAITKEKVGIGNVLGWWLPWVAALILSAQAAIAQFGAVDFMTGQLKDEAALDSTVPLSAAAAVLVVVSWIFLTLTINKASKDSAQ